MNPTQVLQANFDKAADAIVSGDVDTLQSLLQSEPQLASMINESEFQENLLHYVAANGVPNEKQRTPDNIVDIARILLDAGANPNLMADGVYGGGAASTALVCLVSSVHPARAGKQAELVRLFCDYGATVNGINDDAYPLKTAIDTAFVEAMMALVECGARIDTVVTAAAIGDLELVKRFFAEKSDSYQDAFGASLNSVDAVNARALCAATMAGHMEIVRYLVDAAVNINLPVSVKKGTALHEAVANKHEAIARYLLEQGINVSIQDKQGFTALHWAAWNGHLEMVDLLLEYNAPLEIENIYGGTVIDTAVFNFRQDSRYPAPNQIETLQKLIDAGADVSKISPYPTGDTKIDSLLKAYVEGE